MQQRRRAERQRRSITPERALGEAMQLAIEQRKQLIDRRAICLVGPENQGVDIGLQIASVSGPAQPAPAEAPAPANRLRTLRTDPSGARCGARATVEP